jgi:hypothetical protein
LRYIVTLDEKEVARMRGIAKLLFGDDKGELLGLFGGRDADGFGLAERARRTGEWCGSTPGHGPGAGAARPRGLRREMIVREFDPR